MSRLACPILHLARFTLEAKAALSIGSGGAGGVYDHPIVRDANGIPAIPGTSLAGVLRHLWIADHGRESADSIFGFQDRTRGSASRLEVAACAMQGSTGVPVEGLLLDAHTQLHEDPLLDAALATLDDPLFRDRVRIGHRGTASKTGKFDRGIIAAGYRFSGEMRLWSSRKDDVEWENLLALFADPRLRLGGATRAGLGRMACVGLYLRSFDLRNAEDVAAFRTIGAGLGDTTGLTAATPPPADAIRVTRLSFTLTPRDFWRIGQGDQSIGKYAKTPDLLPKLEPVVEWIDNCGVLALRCVVVPGSSIKGAVAHRVAFHWNAMQGVFADDLNAEQLRDWDKSADCEGVRALFGYAKGRDRSENEDALTSGKAGNVIVEDAYVTASTQDVQAMIHSSIDRFTGGVRNRMLFAEELIWNRPVLLSITLLPGVAKTDATVRAALARALLDLCRGRLGVGAGTAKGHGSFSGQPDEATAQWLKAQEEVVL